MNIQLKEIVTSILDLCDKLNQYGGTEKLSFRDLCRTEFVRFVLQISASDCVIKEQETDFLNTYFGWNLPLSEWVKCLKKNQIYRVTVEDEVPMTLKIFVNVDNEYVQKGIGLDKESLGELLMNAFEAIGREIISADNEIDNRELEDLNTYLSNLRNYIREYSKRKTVSIDNATTEDYIDNVHEKVVFLGKKYVLPHTDEIEVYQDLMDSISKAYTKVNDVLDYNIDYVQKGEKGKNYGFYIQMAFWDDISGRGDFVDKIVEAMDDESFDICPSGDNYDNYTKRTTGYSSMVKLADAMEAAAKNILYQKDRNVEYGQEAAYRNAASNIKGVGFGIITNSTADLLFYNAISYSALKSQAKKADEQFARESGAAATKAYDTYSRQLNELFYDQFIPTARKCITTWANEITEKVLSYEIKNGHSVFEEIKKYNSRESNKIVEKIDIKTTKEDAIMMLQQAFEKCPFDFDIYIKAAQIGVLDLETIKLSQKYIYIDGLTYRTTLIQEIEKYCKRSLRNKEIVEKQCEMLLYLKYGDTRKEVLEKIFDYSIKKLNVSYKELENVLSGNGGVVTFIKKNLDCGENCCLFANTSKETIETKIDEYVNRLTKYVDLQFMIDEGLIDYDCLSTEKYADINELNKMYIEHISKLIVEYNEKMKVEQKKFEETKFRYDEELKEKKDLLAEMEKEKESLGLLQIKRKKELESQIINKAEEIKRFEKAEPTLDWC